MSEMESEKRMDKRPKGMNRRMFGKGVLATAGSLLVPLRAEAKDGLESTFEETQMWTSDSPGPVNSEIERVFGAIEKVQQKYLAQKARGATVDELSALRKQMFDLQHELGIRLRQYEEEHGLYTYPEALKPHIARSFEAQVRALNAESRAGERERLLSKYIEKFTKHDLFEDKDEDLISARVLGYYCGYFGICFDS